MTLPASPTPLQRFTGDGSTRVFSPNFEAYSLSEVIAELYDANELAIVLTDGGADTYDYVVSGTLNTATGRYESIAVTLNTAPPTGYTIGLARVSAQAQTLDLTSGGAMPAESVEQRMDRLTAMIQELQSQNDRSIIGPIGIGSLMSAGSRRIIDGADPVNPTDLVTKQFLSTQIITGTTLEANFVSSIAQLRALDTSNNMQAFLTGYSTENDGASGLYVYVAASTATDNGGTVIAPDSGSGRWILNDQRIIFASTFGVVGDGMNGDSTAIENAINYIQGTGQTLYFRAANYFLNQKVGIAVTGDISIQCEQGAVFTAGAGVEDKIFQFNAGAGGADTKLSWIGGKIDGSLQPNPGAGQAWDCINIGEDFHDVHLENIEIYCGADADNSGSDSGIFAVARNIRILNCRFTGTYDAAIYLSADNSELNGESALISGCYFEKCEVGVISKRLFRRYKCVNNDFIKCDVAIATGEASTSLYPGTENIISGNQINQCITGIQAKVSDRTIITDNYIQDFGYDFNDVAISGFGITLTGSKYCQVSNNIIAVRALAESASPTIVGIHLRSSTGLDTTEHSTYNDISHNTILNYTVAISEADTNQDNNHYIHNRTIGATNSTAILGPLSMVVGRDSDTIRRVSMTGLVSLGGRFNKESLRVEEPVSPGVQGNFIGMKGTDSGVAPLITTASNVDTNVDMRFEPKGTGVLQFGTYTTGSGETYAGYITIKDDLGNPRKVAVFN